MQAKVKVDAGICGFKTSITATTEACVVPATVCKAIHVAAGLALPWDVTLKITKD